jgi:FixJ family two-component response regulator
VTLADGLVFIVDDDDSMREALSSLMRSVGLEAKAFASAREFLAQPQADSAACLVLDVRMPGLSGLDLQRELQRSAISIPIIFITGHGDIPMSVRAMKEGAAEFLPKPFREEELLDAIRLCLERDRVARREHAELAGLRSRYESLTSREREVLGPIVRGLMNKQVAAALAISEVTVKVHRRHIIEKMGARSLPELVRMAEKLQIDYSKV